MFDLLSIPVESISFDHVTQYCKQRVREGEHVDYKRSLPSKAEEERIARAVSSFANKQGGMLLYGVESDATDSALPEPSPIGQPLNQSGDARSAVLSACTNAVFPPLTPEMSPFIGSPADPSLGFLVVRVPIGDQMHAVGLGRDTIIRMGSNSVTATDDRIREQQLQKKDAVDLQNHRRAEAIDKLKQAEGLHDTPLPVWVSIGPTVHSNAIFTSGQLGDRRLMSRVSSFSWNTQFPLDPRFEPRGLADAIYFIDETERELAGAIDRFGNVSLYSSLAKKEDFTQLHPLDQMRLEHLHRSDRLIVSLWARMVMERVLTALRSIRLIHREMGFVGLLTLSVQIEQTHNLPLMLGNERRRGLPDCVLGVCKQPVVELQQVVSSGNLHDADGLRQSLWPVADELLTAWGNNNHEMRDHTVEQAEIDHYGPEWCSCGAYWRPTIRPLCRICAAKNQPE